MISTDSLKSDFSGSFQANECIFATITGRDNIEQGLLSISFCRDEDFTKFSLTKQYVMVESPCYYQSLEPFITVLQEIEPNGTFVNLTLTLHRTSLF